MAPALPAPPPVIGDPTRAAFTVFFRESYRSLITAAMYVGATREEADDAAAQAMAEVHRRWAELDKPLAYARCAVVSNFIKAKKRDTRRRQVEQDAATAQCRVDDGMTVWENQEWVRQMVDTLPAGQRAVMELIIDGHTSIEISMLLGRNPAAVRQSLHDARQRLKPSIDLDAHDQHEVRSSAGPARKEAR